MKVETFPHTRKPLHWQRWGVGGGKLQSHRGELSNRGAEGKAERFQHRGSVLTSTHQPERLVCSPTGAGGGWELRLRLWRSDPKEKREDWEWLHEHSLKGSSAPQLAGKASSPSRGRHQKQQEPRTCSLQKGDTKHSKLRKMRRQRKTQQMKEQGKNPPDQTNEEEIGSLPEDRKSVV